jgi:hypothetical protein
METKMASLSENHDARTRIFADIAELVRESDVVYIQGISRDAGEWTLVLGIDERHDARVYRHLCEHMVAPFLVDLAVEVAADAGHDIGDPGHGEDVAN